MTNLLDLADTAIKHGPDTTQHLAFREALSPELVRDLLLILDVCHDHTAGLPSTWCRGDIAAELRSLLVRVGMET